METGHGRNPSGNRRTSEVTPRQHQRHSCFKSRENCRKFPSAGMPVCPCRACTAQGNRRAYSARTIFRHKASFGLANDFQALPVGDVHAPPVFPVVGLADPVCEDIDPLDIDGVPEFCARPPRRQSSKTFHFQYKWKWKVRALSSVDNGRAWAVPQILFLFLHLLV